MFLKKRGIGLLLAAVLAVQPAAVWGDTGDQPVTEGREQENSGEEAETEETAEPSTAVYGTGEASDQEILPEGQAEPSEETQNTGEISPDGGNESAADAAEQMQDTAEEDVVATAGTEVETAAVLNAEETEAVLTIAASEVPENASAVMAEVWSQVNGQDDLEEIPLTLENDSYCGTVSIASHKDTGIYTVEYYAVTNGEKTELGSASFSVSGNQAVLTLEDVDNAAGTAFAVIRTEQVPSGISEIKVSVWSKEDQSDLITLTAKEKSDGSYKAGFRLKKFSYAPGTYHFSADLTAKNGTKLQLDSISQKFTKKAEILCCQKGAAYVLKARGIEVPGGYSNVRFRVISTASGKKKTYSCKASGSAYVAKAATGDFKEYGTYTARAYATDAAGNTVYLGKSSYEISQPTAESVTAAAHQTTGTFALRVRGISATAGLKTVQIAVWSQEDKSDLVWYTASADSDGSYKLSSTIKKHGYHLGTYTAHIYVTDAFSTRKKVLTKKFSIKVTAANVSVSTISEEKSYRVTASDFVVPAGYESLCAAAWSESAGQSKSIAWYDMTETDGAYAFTLKIANHTKNGGSIGQYQVHIYAKRSNGQMVYLGKTSEINLTSAATAVGTISNKNTASGTFDANFTVTGSVTGVKKVEVAVWSFDDQSNLAWYRAAKQSDGSYGITVDVCNHCGVSGKYILHAYVTMGNGIRVYAGYRTCTMNVFLTEEARMNYLFPNGTPTTSSAMQAYLGTAYCRARRADGSIRTITITCHKKLVSTVEKVFEELLDVDGYYVEDAYAYEWRVMASGTGKLSHHSYGVCIDVNADANPASYWGYSPNKSDPRYNNAKVVAIWKKYGFYWGGDWDPSYYDPMHFSWTDH